jgi:hypothetical protein
MAPQIGTNDPGAVIVQRACTNDTSVRFRLVPVPELPRTYTLVEARTGLCVDVDEAFQHDGAWILQWHCTRQPNQQFRMRDIPGAPGYVQLVAVHSGKCVDVDDASKANGALVLQWSCQEPQHALSMRNQSWRVVA